MSRLAASVICLAMSVTPLVTSPDLEVGTIEARVVDGPDGDDELQVSIRVTVTNNADSERLVQLEIQALDSEEFEVFECDLEGRVGPQSTRSITDTQYIKAEIYESISQWRVDE